MGLVLSAHILRSTATNKYYISGLDNQLTFTNLANDTSQACADPKHHVLEATSKMQTCGCFQYY